MNSEGLLQQAKRLAKASPAKPRQVDLKRAISASYYAVFHRLAREVADRFAGTGTNKSDAAWLQAYRSIDHGEVYKRCEPGRLSQMGFRDEIRQFAQAFRDLQSERHRADYDPSYTKDRAFAFTQIQTAELAINDLKAADLKSRRAFCVWVSLKNRT